MKTVVNSIELLDDSFEDKQIRDTKFSSSLPANFNLKEVPRENSKIYANEPLTMVPIINNVPGSFQEYVPNCLREIAKLDFSTYSSSFPEDDTLLELNEDLLICLDLDETMVHVDLEEKFESHDDYISLTEDNQVGVNYRPGLVEFLKKASRAFNLVVFTSSQREYADKIVDKIEEKEKFFKGRFYRDHCIRVNDQFLMKDLTLFRKPLDRIVLIDNNLFSFSNNLENGILISSFYCNPDDAELANLLGFLEHLAVVPDVREVNEQIFRFRTMKEYFVNLKTC